MKPYIYQQPDWPDFRWEQDALQYLLGKVRNIQGKLVGKMDSLGFGLKNEAVLQTLTREVIKTTEIEGETLDLEQVRSSIARRLGMNIPGMIASNRHVDGMVDMMMDVSRNFASPITAERLLNWQSALFPGGRSGLYTIVTGRWRDDSTGPMQVVSGPMGKEKIHFEAQPSSLINGEMDRFINWFNKDDQTIDPVIKAGLAHLWFVTIHPFEDGNGRIARALSEMMLARADGISQRFYSMSAQIRIERNAYYQVLEKTQLGKLDVTVWLQWFLNCLMNAIEASEKVLSIVLDRHKFWNAHATNVLNHRQILMINKIFDGFEGNLTSSKWAKIVKCSPDTALRDIQDLIKKGIFTKQEGGGRSTCYKLIKGPA